MTRKKKYESVLLMKIKLISPRMTLRPMDSQYKRVMSPSISLLVLAALTPPEHDVYIEDQNVCKVNLNDQPDLVGINVNVDTSKQAYVMASHYLRRNIPVVLGGIHVSANPHEAMQHCTAVCVGQAEGIWHTIIADATNGCLSGIYQYKGTAEYRTPLPDWDKINTSRYLYTSIVCTSRGCPFRCDFCYNSCDYMATPYRNRPIEDVIEEINRLGTREVMFIDDNFIGNLKWTQQFLQRIKPMNLSWHAAVSTNIIQRPDILDLMRDTGCVSLFIGFESINSRSINSVQKRQNRVDQYASLIKMIHDRDIMINASLAFGFDHDHPDVFKNTLDWLVQNKVETVTAHILTPYPGTVLYKRMHQANRIIDYDCTNYNTSNVVFQPANMTPEQLRNGYLWLYRNFYSWKNIIKRLPDSHRQRLPYLLFNLIYRKYGKLTSQFARLGFMHALGRLARRISYGIE